MVNSNNICINLNESIKVKLTQPGKDIYFHQYDDVNEYVGREICKPSYPTEDEDGYTEFQLWYFMNLYGDFMDNGLPNVIDPIEIVYVRNGNMNMLTEMIDDDCISRRDAIDAMLDWEMTYDWDDHCREEHPKPEYIVSPSDVIKKLPSAQPERIKARWILAENQRPEDMENDNYLFVCSNCGSTDLHSKRVPVPYCWNCGAEMLREVTE